MKPEDIDELKLAIAIKLTIRTKRAIRKMTMHCDDPCQCRENLCMTVGSLINFGRDVFSFRPEYYMALAILARASEDMIQEWEKTTTGKVIHL